MESQWGKRNVRRRNFSKGGELDQDTPSMIPPSATIEQHPTMLFLPGNYSEEQLASLLSHAVSPPKIMNSNAMVTVIDAPPLRPVSSATEDEDSFFREFLVDDPDDPDGAIDNTWGSPVDKSSEMIPAETMSLEMSSVGISPAKIMPIEIPAADITPDEIVPNEISSDNIAPVSDISNDNFSDVMETMFGVDSPQDVEEFEKSQENQFLAVMTTIKPLEQVLGDDSGELCTVCFHLGHYQSNFSFCPVARLRSFFSGNSCYDSFPGLAPAIELIKKDLGYICQSLSWAITYKNTGYLEQVGIFYTALTDIQALLHAWKSILSKETFEFGKFGTLNVEILTVEPVDIPMIKTKGMVYQQNFCQPDEISGGIQDYIPPEIGISRKDALLKLSAREVLIAPFGPAPADSLKLEVLGARPNTICATCLHRGHTQNSTKLCPFKMISVAINKMKTRGRKKRINDVTKEVERLQKLVDDVGPGVKGIRNIMNLLDEWHKTVEKNVAWGKSKAPAASPSIPIGFVDYKMADTFAAILQEGNSSNSHGATNQARNLSPEVVDGSTYTHLARKPCQSSHDPLENNAEQPSFAFRNSHNDIIYPEDLNQLYSTFDDLGGGQDFGASSHDPSASFLAAADNQPRSQGETQKIMSPQAYRRTSSSTSTSQMLVDSTPAPVEEWGGSSQDDELPPDILWRRKCTLRTIGVRGDNLCKSCLHYGHDRSSYACPAQLVLRSILAGDDVSSTASSVEDLRSAIEWQKSIPKDIRGDYESIQSLVHRWEAAVKQSKSQIFETAVDNPVHKRRRRSAILENQPENPQLLKEQVLNSPSLVRIGYKGQKIASPVSMQINYKDQLNVAPARPMHMGHASQYMIQTVPVQQQRDFPQEVLPTKRCNTASEGVFFDYHRIPGHLLSVVMDYVIEESGEGNEDRLLVDHRKMPKALFLNLRSYLSKDPEPAATSDQQPKKCDKRKRT